MSDEFDSGYDSSDDEVKGTVPMGSPIPGITNEELAAFAFERQVMEEDEKTQAARLMRDHLVPAVKSVTNLALYSRNEKIRMTAAQYVIERNIGRVQDQSTIGRSVFDDLLGDCVSEIEDGFSELDKKINNQ